MNQIPFLTNTTFAAAWWTPMTVYNGATYVAFTSTAKSGRHFLNVAKKDTSGKWLNHMMTRYDYEDDLGHNQAAIAIDGSGRIHVVTSMHVNTWTSGGGHYYRSVNGEDVRSWVNDSASMPGQEYNYRYTYPIMRRHPSGDIYFLARRVDTVTEYGPMVMYKWTNSTSTWSSVGVVTSSAGDNMYVYPDDMQITSDGIVHIIYAHHAGQASPRRHLPAYIKYNPSNGTWKTADDVTQTLPILYTTTNLVYKAMVAGETTATDEPGPGHQSAALSMTLGYPSIFYRHRDADNGINKVRRARWNGAGWPDELIYDGSETTAAITHNIDATNIDCYFCAIDTDNEPKVFRYRKNISSGVATTTKVSDIRLSRLYQEGTTLFASHPVTQEQYLYAA